VSRLGTALGFAGHLLRRVPVVVREGRVPTRPRDLAAKLRRAFRAYWIRAGGPELEPARLPRPGPRAGGPPRALFLSHNLNLEGAPIFELLLARGLQDRGYDVWVIGLRDGALRSRYQAHGIPVVLGDALFGVRGAPAYQRRMASLADWVRRSAFDVVFCNTLRSFWGVTVAHLAGVPAVWAIHESVEWRRYFDYLPPVLNPVALECLAGADRLVFACDATRRLYADLDAPAGRLARIHYGLDLAAIDRFRRERPKAELRAIHGVRAGERVVSIVGTTCERKGQLDFLRMARALTRAGTTGVRYYVVGTRPGEYLRRIEQLQREERLDSVVLVKETPDVFDYYALSDVFVCASYEESFPVVNLEAMAFELPIVSTNVFGVPEALEDGRDALLVRAGDVAGLAAGVGRLLADPALAGRLAASARGRVETEFTLARMTEDYHRLFATCLAR
jgi:glycosyltransferase involved in cell wall biosynthesis